MKLIVGLGNPGKKYEATRHNAGFLVLDAFTEGFEGGWTDEKKLHSLIAKETLHGETATL